MHFHFRSGNLATTNYTNAVNFAILLLYCIWNYKIIAIKTRKKVT